METTHISRDSRYIFIYYIFLAALWIYFFITGKANADGVITLGGALYQFALGIIPLVGGILGLTKAGQWGWSKSFVGRAVLLISAGAICWGIGQMFWSLYYNIISRVDIPYPSLADVGYSLSFPFLALGLVSLSKATGARFSLKQPLGKLLAVLITLLGTIAAYYLLVVVARGGVIDFTEGGLKLFFDIVYPLGDLVIFVFSALIYGLSFNYLGGTYKIPILSILAGMLVLFIGDFTFSYTTTVGTYYNGHWVDFGVNSIEVKKQQT
jgi:hypothetical protein